MNVIFEKEEGLFEFMANVNFFSIDEVDINFQNGNTYIMSVSKRIIKDKMLYYFPALQDEDFYSYYKENKFDFDNILKNIFNSLLLAYRNNEDVYIMKCIEDEVRKYFTEQQNN